MEKKKNENFFNSNKNNTDYIPFIEWIVEVAEERIIEHRLLNKVFSSQDEFIVFTIVWMRVYKRIFLKLKKENDKISLDKFIKDFYDNQNDDYLGTTINAISRESEIPRSTAKRIVESLIKKQLVSRNLNRLIIPTSNVREVMENYRQFNFRSYKKICNLFNKLELEKKFKEGDNF